MTDAPLDESTELAPASAARRVRVWRTATPKLDAESARRQGAITHLAFLELGGREAAIAFLNEPHPAVGGRPLAVATASEDGYRSVEALIRDRG